MPQEPRLITSAKNPQIQWLRALKNTAPRREAGVFTVEGEKLAAEVCPPWQVRLIVTAESMARSGKIPRVALHYPEAERLVTPDSLFATLCETKTPQGVLAVVEARAEGAENLRVSGAEPALFVALEDVQDPGNVGTILRSADAVNASGVLCSRQSADPFSPKTVRASMGSVFHLPVLVEPSLINAVMQLKAAGCQVVAAHLEGAKSLYQVDFTGPTVVLVGNEGQGLSAEITRLADQKMRIPQPGRAESLNVGVAASVILYEALRQRTGGSIQ